MFVCTPDSTTRLRANCTSSLSAGAQFAMEILPTTGRFLLRKAGGNYLSISPSGWLYASAGDTASAAEFARLSPIP
jgi:hypothetical protein